MRVHHTDRPVFKQIRAPGVLITKAVLRRRASQLRKLQFQPRADTDDRGARILGDIAAREAGVVADFIEEELLDEPLSTYRQR